VPDHAAHRDQFEIISICIDCEGGLKSKADVDWALEPIVRYVWGGNALPFAVQLDPTFKTWERFGLTGLGTVISDRPGRETHQGR
jgi:hypothetical protein